MRRVFSQMCAAGLDQQLQLKSCALLLLMDTQLSRARTAASQYFSSTHASEQCNYKCSYKQTSLVAATTTTTIPTHPNTIIYSLIKIQSHHYMAWCQ
jgi:hypothetical protein